MGQTPLASFQTSVPYARVRRGCHELPPVKTSWWLDTEDGEDVADFNRFARLECKMQPFEKGFSYVFDIEYYLHVGGGRRVLLVLNVKAYKQKWALHFKALQTKNVLFRRRRHCRLVVVVVAVVCKTRNRYVSNKGAEVSSSSLLLISTSGVTSTRLNMGIFGCPQMAPWSTRSGPAVSQPHRGTPVRLR